MKKGENNKPLVMPGSPIRKAKSEVREDLPIKTKMEGTRSLSISAHNTYALKSEITGLDIGSSSKPVALSIRSPSADNHSPNTSPRSSPKVSCYIYTLNIII